MFPLRVGREQVRYGLTAAYADGDIAWLGGAVAEVVEAGRAAAELEVVLRRAVQGTRPEPYARPSAWRPSGVRTGREGGRFRARWGLWPRARLAADDQALVLWQGLKEVEVLADDLVWLGVEPEEHGMGAAGQFRLVAQRRKGESVVVLSRLPDPVFGDQLARRLRQALRLPDAA